MHSYLINLEFAIHINLQFKFGKFFLPNITCSTSSHQWKHRKKRWLKKK